MSRILVHPLSARDACMGTGTPCTHMHATRFDWKARPRAPCPKGSRTPSRVNNCGAHNHALRIPTCYIGGMWCPPHQCSACWGSLSASVADGPIECLCSTDNKSKVCEFRHQSRLLECSSPRQSWNKRLEFVLMIHRGPEVLRWA